MQAGISLLFLPSFNIDAGLLTWNEGAAYTQGMSKALSLDILLERTDFFLS